MTNVSDLIKGNIASKWQVEDYPMRLSWQQPIIGRETPVFKSNKMSIDEIMVDATVMPQRQVLRQINTP